jgi:uncharacterized membrane protein YbhN (UPF0104 family)
LAALYLLPTHTTLALVVLAVCGGLMAGLTGVFVVAFRWSALGERLERTPLRPIIARASVLASDEARAVLHNVRSQTARLFAISAAVMVLQVAVVVALAEALGVHAPIAFLAAAASLIVLVVMLPISIAGLGSREGMLILLFTAAGEPREDAIALGVLLFFVGLIARLPGVIGWVYRGYKPGDDKSLEPVVPMVEPAALVD